MGEIVKYTCKKCGFTADDLAIGPSMFQNAHNEIVRCVDCDEVMTKPVDENNIVIEKYRKCNQCGGSNFVIWDKVCPKCGCEKFESKLTGWWD